MILKGHPKRARHTPVARCVDKLACIARGHSGGGGGGGGGDGGLGRCYSRCLLLRFACDLVFAGTEEACLTLRQTSGVVPGSLGIVAGVKNAGLRNSRFKIQARARHTNMYVYVYSVCARVCVCVRVRACACV